MKPYLLIIALLAFSILYGCKPEYVTPLVKASPKSSDSASSVQNSFGSLNISTTVDPAHLIGKWSLVKDSTSWCIGADTVIHSNNYWGTADDYFDFRSDGKCYIKEKSCYDTMTFKMPTDTSVIFGKSNGYQVSNTGVWTPIPTPPNKINPFTDRDAKITYTSLAGPGGITGRTVYLKK
ncbi:MAG: hypothetical protein JWP78_1658 [Mucilaginibacter sp.]|nr:hypothetical protein [Mucilaginibacter sp.]